MSQQILPMRKQKSKIIKLKSIITTKKFTLGIQQKISPGRKREFEYRLVQIIQPKEQEKKTE